MREVLPGVHDWTAVHEKLGFPVHSHAVRGTLVDPMLPEQGGIDALRALEPERIVLTNRHHDRNAQEIADALGVPVLCHRDGLHEFEQKPLDPSPYEDGEEVAPGIRAYELVEGWFGECALHVQDAQLAIIADTVTHEGEQLGFPPDQFLGDDPEAEKEHLRGGVRRLLELDFDNLLFAHGSPLVGGAKAALAEFVQA